MQPGSTTTRSALSQYYAALGDAELEQLLRDPRIGAAAVERINAERARRLGEPVVAEPKQREPKSTNPRATMTRVEMRMADLLDMRKRQGEVQTWFFEAITLRVGTDRCTYRPDFFVLLADGSVEVIEVKGAHVFDDSRVKWKTAKLLYPCFRWRFLQWIQDEWREVYA